MKLKVSPLFIIISRNVLFWLVITYFHYNRSLRPDYFILAVSFVCSYGIGGYINNLWLIPSYLMRRRYAWYIGLLLPLMVATGCAAYFVTHFIDRNFHNIDFQAAINDENVYYFAFTTLLVFTCLAFGKFIGEAIMNRRQLEELEKKRVESELANLRSQINPHFLFNALNTIYGIARRTDNDTAEAVLKLSGILRHGLYECGPNDIPLEKEISFLTQYVEFARLRLHDKNSILMKVDMDVQEQKIAPLLLMPFIENAIKHGLGKHANNSWISINLLLEGNELNFRCANSNHNKKQGHAEAPGHNGIGLKNVKRRLEILYPGKHHLNIADEENAYIVALKLQLK